MSILDGIQRMAVEARVHGIMSWRRLYLPTHEFQALRFEILERFGTTGGPEDSLTMLTCHGPMEVRREVE